MATDSDEAREELVERVKLFVAEMHSAHPHEVRMDDQSVNYQLVMLVMNWYEDMVEEDEATTCPEDVPPPEGSSMNSTPSWKGKD